MTLRDLLNEADAGPWWFDGRDIFHRRPGTNLDQLILPIPSAEETFHPSQAVNPATARLASLAPDLATLLADIIEDNGTQIRPSLLARYLDLNEHTGGL